MSQTESQRILATPTAYTKTHYLYVQEVGTLKSVTHHVSRREKLDSYLFFLVMEGSGVVTQKGVSHPIKAGDCVWLNCLDAYSHESSTTDPWTLMWVHFNGVQARSFYEFFLERESPATYTPASLTPYTDCIMSLYQLQQKKDALSDLLSHRHLTDLIAQIFSDTSQIESGSLPPEKFADIRSYLEEHYAQKLSLDMLAQQFFISKYHLLREYQRIYGTTIMNDLTIRRLSHAKYLLRFSDESVETIALKCGFQTSSYFIKVFKRYENATPLEYRRKW